MTDDGRTWTPVAGCHHMHVVDASLVVIVAWSECRQDQFRSADWWQTPIPIQLVREKRRYPWGFICALYRPLALTAYNLGPGRYDTSVQSYRQPTRHKHL